MLVQANIPLEKADHPAVRQFLSAHVLNGGAIPKADCLRRLHLPRLMEEEEAKLHALFDGSSYICVIADESRDVKNRPVLNILFQTLTPIDKLQGDLKELNTPLLVKSVFIENVTHATVSQAIIQVCADFSIDFTKVMLFVSDSASYMMKAWKDILSVMWINCHHMNCLAHIVALAGNTLRVFMRDVDRCVSLLKSIFVRAPSRCNRFLGHLQSKGATTSSIPPEPVITRWNTWFNAVRYHSSLLHHYSSFVHTERETEADSAALKELATLVELRDLQKHFGFVAQNCPRLVATLDSWQSRKPQVHTVYNTLYDLISFLSNLATATEDEICALAADAAAKKLEDYTQEKKQNAIQFLKAVRLLDPTQLPTLDASDFEHISSVLHFPKNCEDEWAIYLRLAGDIGYSKPFPLSFWKAL